MDTQLFSKIIDLDHTQVYLVITQGDVKTYFGNFTASQTETRNAWIKRFDTAENDFTVGCTSALKFEIAGEGSVSVNRIEHVALIKSPASLRAEIAKLDEAAKYIVFTDAYGEAELAEAKYRRDRAALVAELNTAEGR